MRRTRPDPPSFFHAAVVLPTRRKAHLFLRHANGRLHHRGILSERDIPASINRLPQPNLVVLAGPNADADHRLRNQLLALTDLFVVSKLWLQHIPPHDLHARALAAARAAHAHLLDPIAFQLREENPYDDLIHGYDDDIPF